MYDLRARRSSFLIVEDDVIVLIFQYEKGATSTVLYLTFSDNVNNVLMLWSLSIYHRLLLADRCLDRRGRRESEIGVMVLAELAGGSRQENKLKAEAVQDHTYYYLLTGTLSRTYLIGSMTERNVAHTANQ